MANEKSKAAFKLPPEMIKSLKEDKDKIDAAEKQMEALEKLGMDMREPRERLAWAKNVRKTLLEEFSDEKP
jgi:hypothetical protein